MEKNLKITFSSSISKLCEINNSFDSGILKVAYHGDNRNGSRISKDTFERCIDTIYNCPIVCNYDRESDEIGSHDVDVVVKDGSVKLINITQPVGVIPESAKYWWESFEDNTGLHEYLCVEALIWKRQEAYEKIKENVITDESMEIKVTSGHMDGDVYVIDAFEFLAFCLLGTAEPCYETASLEMFSVDEFRKKYTDMMEEFKQTFQKVNSAHADDIESENYLEGGKDQVDEKNALMAEFGLSADALDFNIEDFSLEELKAKFEAMSPAGEDPVEDTKKDFELEAQFLRELMTVLESETVQTEWGQTSRYWFVDYDRDANEVYVEDRNDGWNLYGLPYSMNGDHVAIDFACRKRKKYSIVDFNEGDTTFSHQKMFEAVAKTAADSKAAELNAQFEAEKAQMEERYAAASDTINSMNHELEELRSYKQNKLTDERAAAEDAVFAMFTDLNGVEAFEKLRKNCSELTIEDLEDKCFALRGRNATQTFAAQKQAKAPRLPIEKNKSDDEPYKGLFLEFPPNR